MKETEQKEWQQVKGKLISRFGMLRVAAETIGCHTNALRKAVQGKAPKVMERMNKYL